MYNYKQNLSEKWELYVAENNKCKNVADKIYCEKDLIDNSIMHINGTVPGNFELDLEKAEIIEDPFFGLNPLKIQEIENYHLWYVCNFKCDCENVHNIVLGFEGIDTFSDIYLNGVKIGETENMFIPYEFEASSIKLGINELVIHIRPTIIETRKYKYGLDVNYYQPYAEASLFARRPAHTYGWDIMPRFISGGIWRNVYLAEKKDDYIEEIYLYTDSIDDEKAIISGYFTVCMKKDFSKDYSLEFKGECKTNVFTEKIDRLWHNQGKISFTVNEPLLWWPRDAGEQNLYKVEAVLRYKGEIIDIYSFDFGIRTVCLEHTDTTDENGSGQFLFYINNTPIYMRGTNWVALDAFHSRDTLREGKALELLYESNCNMVRCWGGNVYPDSRFYDFCDKYGILVWQDFALACASYPQNEEFCSEFAKEVQIIVKQLRLHPSLVIWAGDNECDVATAYWTFAKVDPTKNKLTREIIPNILKFFDRSRPYLPSSPYVSDEYFNDLEGGKYMPEEHLWGSRKVYKNKAFLDTKAHFVSEIGAHGCPSPESIKKFISKDKLWHWENNDEWIVHSSSMDLENWKPYEYRIPLMQEAIDNIFGIKPDNLNDYALASQLCQAEALKFFIEYFRCQKWRRTGLLWWNLTDGWPQFSDAVVDYYFIKKIAFEFIKRSQEALCIMMREPENGFLKVVSVNDFLKSKCLKITIKDTSNDNVVFEKEVIAEANSVTEFVDIKVPDDGMHLYLIEWQCDGVTYKNHYLCDKAPYDFEKYVKLLKKAELFCLDGFDT